jgi:hypothetical protein
MKPREKKLVVMGAHGPVCMENNSHRFIGSEPVEVEMSAYYLRRMADGELVEAPKAKPAKKDKE